MRIEVDEMACVAAGRCVMASMEVFDQREEDGVVILLDETPPPELHDAAREAAMLCPSAAIRVIE